MEDYISLHDRKERLLSQATSLSQRKYLYFQREYSLTLVGAKGIGNNRIKNISIFNVFNSYNNIRCEGKGKL
jgi:hypothetical protein